MQLSLFFFSKVLFISFWKFGFLKNAKDGKLNMLRKRRKLKWQIFGEGENQKNANGGRKAEKVKYEITTSLISQREHHILRL
jgi:hypothetical protein